MAQAPDDPPLRFRAHIFFCMNARSPDDPRGCCVAKGSALLRDHMKTRAKALGLKDVRINQAGCLDACAQGPALVVYPEGVWYRCDSKADADEILIRHIRDGGRVERLLLDVKAAKD